MRQEVVSKIEEIVQRVAASDGIEVVEVEFKGSGGNQLLRISIDKPQGISHADCEMISQQVGTILDVEDIVPGRYTLEESPTLMKAISLGGGLTPYARKKGIELIRMVNGAETKTVVDLKAIEDHKIEDIPLMAEDQILVPRRMF